jgi:hypothetical protein
MITRQGYSKDPSIMPEGIVITFPVQFLLDIAPQLNSCQSVVKSNGSYRIRYNTRKHQILAGYRQCIKEIEQVRKDADNTWWWHSIGNRPTIKVLNAYIIILGRIRYKAVIVGWEPGGEKQFVDNRKLSAKHWLQLAYFEPAPFAIERKGFQGFRYCTKLF